MYFSSLSAALLIGAASSVGATAAGQHLSHRALAELETLFGRQTVYCAPIEAPYTCERSCGPGYTECIAFPTCYDPSIGEVCCSNGDYCDAGQYCTDGGCCDNDQTLEECGATVSLSVLLPGAASTAAASTSSTTSAASTTSSASHASTSTSASSAGNGGAGQPLGGSTSSTTKSSTTTKASSTSTASSSTTSSSPVKQTAASAAGLNRDSPLVNLVLGGLGVLLLL